MCVGVSVWLGWGGISVAGFSLLHWYQCGDKIEKSQAPDDGYINVRNMLSIEEVKWNLITSDIKLVSYSSTIYFWSLSIVQRLSGQLDVFAPFRLKKREGPVYENMCSFVNTTRWVKSKKLNTLTFKYLQCVVRSRNSCGLLTRCVSISIEF